MAAPSRRTGRRPGGGRWAGGAARRGAPAGFASGERGADPSAGTAAVSASPVPSALGAALRSAAAPLAAVAFGAVARPAAAGPFGRCVRRGAVRRRCVRRGRVGAPVRRGRCRRGAVARAASAPSGAVAAGAAPFGAGAGAALPCVARRRWRAGGGGAHRGGGLGGGRPCGRRCRSGRSGDAPWWVAAAGGIGQLGVVLVDRQLGRGQPHAEQRAAAGVLLDPHLPVVRRHDLGDDGQAEAGAAVGAGAGVVEPHEPLEDPVAVVGGHAGTVVGDVEGRLVAVAPERDDHLRAGVPVRVVDQVAQHPHELAAVADHPHVLGAHLGAHPVFVRPGALRLDELVEVHLVAPGLQAALVGAGEEQEVVHQPPEPLGLAAQRAHGAGIAVLQQLQARTDGGERAAQLVAGVGDEPPLHLLRALQPRDHARSWSRRGDPPRRAPRAPARARPGPSRSSTRPARGSPRPGAARGRRRSTWPRPRRG